MRNIHPAYELAMVRADIDRLRQREAFLRRGFLGDTLPPMVTKPWLRLQSSAAGDFCATNFPQAF